MKKKHTPVYKPELAEGQEIIAILSIGVCDMLTKVLNLFPDNDILLVEKNLIHERIGANCFVEIDISELMRTNVQQDIRHGGKTWNQATLSLNLYNKDKRFMSFHGGNEVFVIADEKEHVLWFKNDVQELSFPWCKKRPKVKMSPPSPKEGEHVTEVLSLKGSECSEIRSQSAKSEYLDLEIYGDKLASFRLDDGSRYSLLTSMTEVDLTLHPVTLRSYHFLHFPKRDYKLQVAKVGDDFILHSEIGLKPADVNMYEFLSFIR